MLKSSLKNDFSSGRDEHSKCPVCEVYINQSEGFICPQCRRGPLCKKHRVAGWKECASCVFDLMKKTLDSLRGQETSIRQFLRFLQFLFLVFAVFFTALRFGLAEFVEILRTDMISTYILYLGFVPALGYVLFGIILYNQRGKIEDMVIRIKKLEVRR